MIIIQSVLNHLKNINPTIRAYAVSLMLASGRKNCAAMAHLTKVPVKQLYAFLSKSKRHAQIIEDELLLLAKKTRKLDALRALIVDPTTIIKSYAQKIQGVGYDRSGCTKNIERCLVPVYVAVADRNITIPLNLDFWVQEKILGTKRYKSKGEITCELIEHVIKKGVESDFVSLDGAYATPRMFAFFQEKKEIKFVMRIARNRKVKLPDGTRIQLQQYLRLNRNERTKMIKAELYGATYFFTACKRKKKDGNSWETVYIVSNMDLPAKEQAAAYELRWPVEKMNRTTKQKFGTTECQAIQVSKQRAHIMAAFLAYSILGSLKIDYKSQSVDELVNIIRNSHSDDLVASVKKRQQIKNQANIDPIVKTIQNIPPSSSKEHDLISCSMH